MNAHSPDHGLTTWLQANVPGLSGPFTLEKFAGGQSNPTYRRRTGQTDLVPRRKGAAAFLTSNASSDMIGQTIVIDGGMTIGGQL